MTAQDAKFILRAHRADGRYRSDDPLVLEALAAAANDPALADWLAREQALDATIGAKLDGIAPPPGLRDAILVGSRASRVARPWWRKPAWLGVAASVAILLTIGTVLTRPTPARATPTDLAEFSLDQLAFERHVHQRGDEVAALEASLAACTEPLCGSALLDSAHLAPKGCTELSFGGNRVYEICFKRNGQWYHLYVTTKTAPDDGEVEESPRFVERYGLAAAMWSRGSTVFALATKAGPEALKAVL